FDREEPSSGVSGPTGVYGTVSPATRRATRLVGMLPAKCKFEGGQLLQDRGTAAPSEWLAGLPDATEDHDALWSRPILFSPDGTATATTLTVNGPKGDQVHVTVRGLTGGVTVSSVNPK